MRKYLLQSLFILFSFGAFGQTFPSQQWRYGEAVLLTGDTIKGSMKYNLERQIIQFRKKDKVATYNASQLVTFAVKNDFVRNRTFYSLPIKNKAGYTQPSLFEMISEGEVSLIGREYIAIVTAFSNNSMIRPMDRRAYLAETVATGRKQLAYKLYIAKSSGEIVPLGESKKTILDAFGDQKSELKKYIRIAGLELTNVSDFIKIIRFYNSLNNSDTIMERSDT